MLLPLHSVYQRKTWGFLPMDEERWIGNACQSHDNIYEGASRTVCEASLSKEFGYLRGYWSAVYCDGIAFFSGRYVLEQWGDFRYESFVNNLFLLALLCPPITLLAYRLLLIKSKSFLNLVVNYEFSDAGVVVNISQPAGIIQTRVSYAHFDSVYETNDFFYFYDPKQRAYILGKADIYYGNVSELQNLLKRYIPPDKYKVKNI